MKAQPVIQGITTMRTTRQARHIRRKRATLSELAREAAIPAICILIIGYFAYHATLGPSGLFAWGGYKREQAVLQQRADVLTDQKTALAARAKLLDPRKVDPDLADELVRKDLGVVRPDEVVIPLR